MPYSWRSGDASPSQITWIFFLRVFHLWPWPTDLQLGAFLLLHPLCDHLGKPTKCLGSGTQKRVCFEYRAFLVQPLGKCLSSRHRGKNVAAARMSTLSWVWAAVGSLAITACCLPSEAFMSKYSYGKERLPGESVSLHPRGQWQSKETIPLKSGSLNQWV